MAARVAMFVFTTWGTFWSPILEKARSGVSGGTIRTIRRAIMVSYRFSVVTIALFLTIRLQVAMECLRRSSQQGLGQFGQNLDRKQLTGVNRIFTRSERDVGLLYAKEIMSLFSAV